MQQVINPALTMINKSLLSLMLFLGISMQARAEQSYQSHDALYELVKATIERHLDSAMEYEISVVPLDSQLKLPACAIPVEAYTTSDLIKPGRTSVGVRCNADKKWSVFISASVTAYENVIVLTRPVQRGEIITGQHLAIEKRKVSVRSGEIITRIDLVENKQAARYLPAGSILGLNSVIEPRIIKRGEKITITSVQPGFAVRVSGVAMMDGAKGQRIRIKNESSGRILSATVIEPGLVAVK